MKKDKRRWSAKTQEGQQKLVNIGGTEYRPFTPTTEFQTIFNELEIESNKVKLPKIKSSKLLAPKGRIHKYIILSPEDSITNNRISRLGFSKVFFNANKTTAIFTFEMYIYHQFSIFKQTSTFLLVKKDGYWRLTTSLVEQKGCPF